MPDTLRNPGWAARLTADPPEKTLDWTTLLAPETPLGAVLRGGYAQGPRDIPVSHDGLEFCLCGAEFTTGDPRHDGVGPSWSALGACLEIRIGDAPFWAPLTREGAATLERAVYARVLERFVSRLRKRRRPFALPVEGF